MDTEMLKYTFEDLYDFKSPYRGFQGDQERLRALCALSVERFPDVEPLRTFTMVGATIFDLDMSPRDAFEVATFQTGMGADKVDYKDVERDTKYFRDFVVYLIRSGIPVSPDFVVTVENLLYEQDYLASDTQADVTMFRFLPGLGYDELTDPDHELAAYYAVNHYKVFDPDDAFQNKYRAEFREHIERKEYGQAWIKAKYLGGVCSPLSTPENWARRVVAANSKIVITENGTDSLPIHLMGSNMMSPVVLESETRGLSMAMSAEIAQERTPGRAIDIAMSEPFIEEVAGQLTDQTLMAMKVKHDRRNGFMPDMRQYKEWGTFEDRAGENFIPYPPYSKPWDLTDDRGNAVQYLDVFWSLANDFCNPTYGNMAYGWRVDEGVRTTMAEHIHRYFGEGHDAVLQLGLRQESPLAVGLNNN